MRTRLRNLALDLVLGGLRLALRVLSAVVPQSRSRGASRPSPRPRATRSRRPGRCCVATTAGWCGCATAGPVPREVRRAGRPDGMVLVAKASAAGLWAYLRAEAVFFTHGLYGSPRPSRRKPLVNLWHGDGPKDIRPADGVGALIASTYLVGSTALFSVLQGVGVRGAGRPGAVHRQPADRPAVARRRRPSGWPRLGIEGPFVVWMPTFRRARAVGRGARPRRGPGAGAGLRRHARPAAERAPRARHPAGDQAAPDGRRPPPVGRRRHRGRGRPGARRGRPLRAARRLGRAGHRLLQRLGRLPAAGPADRVPGHRPGQLRPAALPRRRPRLAAGRAGGGRRAAFRGVPRRPRRRRCARGGAPQGGRRPDRAQPDPDLSRRPRRRAGRPGRAAAAARSGCRWLHAAAPAGGRRCERGGTAARGTGSWPRSAAPSPPP